MMIDFILETCCTALKISKNMVNWCKLMIICTRTFARLDSDYQACYLLDIPIKTRQTDENCYSTKAT